MKIDHVRIDPDTGHSVTIVTGIGAAEIQEGAKLRCAAYRFEVIAKIREYPEAAAPTAAFLIKGDDAPKPGMVIHLEQEPLTDEELSAAIRHLLMIPRMLKAVDALKVGEALDRVPGDARAITWWQAALTLRTIAQSVVIAQQSMPADAELEHADRYLENLLRALA
jgi:hypothetical protein